MVVQNRWLLHGFICLGALLFILICLGCFPAIAAEKAAAPAQVTWNIPRLPQPPKIDGDLSEWANIVPVFLGVEKDQIRYYSLRPWAGPLDSSARIWMAWDKNNLYFAADIRDDNFYQTCSLTDLAEIWSEDSLWLTVASADKTKQDGTVVFLSEFNWAIVTSGRSAISAKRGTEGQKAGAFPVAARKKAAGNGWICEGAIPWKEIPLSAHPGLLIRLSWVIADNDSGSKALAVPLIGIGAKIDPEDLYIPDLIALFWPRSVGRYYIPWNFALAKLSDTPPPADSKIAEDAAEHIYQDLLAGAKKLKPGEALLWTAHAHMFFEQPKLAEKAYKVMLVEHTGEKNVSAALRAAASLIYARTKDLSEAITFCRQSMSLNRDSYDIGFGAGSWITENLFLKTSSPKTYHLFEQILSNLVESSEDTMGTAGFVAPLLEMIYFLDGNSDEHPERKASNDQLINRALYLIGGMQLKNQKSILSRSIDASLHYIDGMNYYRAGDLALAAQELAEALSCKEWQGTEYVPALATLGHCYYYIDKNYKAIYWLKRALKENRDSKQDLMISYELALAYLKDEKFAAAKELFQKVAADPTCQYVQDAKQFISKCYSDGEDSRRDSLN